jgi:hypothetical protein
MRLSEIVHDGVERGLLPSRRPKMIWRGHGDRRLCSACRAPIFADQMRYEFETIDGAFRFHERCFVVWQVDLIQRGWLLIG